MSNWTCSCGKFNSFLHVRCYDCNLVRESTKDSSETLQAEVDLLSQRLFSLKSENALLRLANKDLKQTLKDVKDILYDSIDCDQFINMRLKILKEMAKQHDHLINKAIERIGELDEEK